MAYELIENKERREATIRMYGVIGRDVDGNRMAYDIAQLDKDADTIHILINSDGEVYRKGCRSYRPFFRQRPISMRM